MLYSIDIFSDNSFLLEVTVLLSNELLKFHKETESVEKS